LKRRFVGYIIFDKICPLTYPSIVSLDGKRNLKLEKESKKEKMHRYWIRLSCSCCWQILCDIRL